MVEGALFVIEPCFYVGGSGGLARVSPSRRRLALQRKCLAGARSFYDHHIARIWVTTTERPVVNWRHRVGYVSRFGNVRTPADGYLQSPPRTGA